MEREAAKPAAKGKSMASMWSKAPPKKAPAPAAKPAAVPENEAAASDEVSNPANPPTQLLQTLLSFKSGGFVETLCQQPPLLLVRTG